MLWNWALREARQLMNNQNNNNNLLWRYAGLATQFMVGIALALFVGLKMDQWLKIKMPLAVWGLPLLLIIAVIIRIIKDTAKRNNNT